MDYSKLNLLHKGIMALVHKRASSVKEEERTEEVQTMLDTYNSKVDFVDFSTLDGIINEIKGI